MAEIKQHPTLGIMVRSDGQILVPANCHQKEHWTFGCSHHTGYLRVCIKGKSYLVHRLVAETFIPNPENLPQVDHIKYDQKDNNDISNLRWVSNLQNQYNKSTTRPVGSRKCDVSRREYNRIATQKWRAKQKEAKCD